MKVLSWLVVLAMLLGCGWERTARILWLVGCVWLWAKWRLGFFRK